MDIQTKENSIRVLKRLRDVYQGQLDTRVIVEIEAVIAAMEEDCDCSNTDRPTEDWRMRVLKLIADVLRLATNISELMK